MISPLLIALAAAAPTADRLDHDIARGQLLAVADFAPGLPAPGALPATAAAGREARRLLVAGSVVRDSDLVAPRLVRRGDIVTIRVRRGALTISASGKALGDAGLGEALKVVTDTSHRTLDARASSPGAVDVTLP